MTGFSMTTCFIRPYPMFVWWVRGLVVVLKTFMQRCEYVTRPVRKVKGEGTIGDGCGPKGRVGDNAW